MPLLAWKLIGYAVIAITMMGMGAKLMSIWDAGQIAGYKATIARQNAVVKQVTAVTAQITASDQAAEAAAQTALAGRAQIIIKRIPVYVSSSAKPAVGCVTNGMLRVHDAAVLGVDPSEVVPPAAQPDAACSAVAPSDFMAGVAANYAAANENAEQLNSLSSDIKSRAAAVANAKP